jgi:hypothetical protein
LPSSPRKAFTSGDIPALGQFAKHSKATELIYQYNYKPPTVYFNISNLTDLLSLLSPLPLHSSCPRPSHSLPDNFHSPFRIIIC